MLSGNWQTVQDQDVGLSPNGGMVADREVWAPEGVLGPEQKSGSWSGPLGQEMVVWTTVELWTQIND